MQIQIDFKNDTPNADNIRVYRSDTKFNKTNLPALYETIAGNAVTYVDNAAPPDKPQFYMFGIVKGDFEALSICFETSSLLSSGPGPIELIRGDMECGYYGTFIATDFVPYSGLLDQLPAFSGNRYANTIERWMKFAYKGKILFIPEKPMMNSVPWNTIYNAGLVYGVSGPGPRDVNTLTPVDQLKLVTLRNYQFIVRLPTVIPSTASPVTIDLTNKPSGVINNTVVYHPAGNVTAAKLGDNEWDDLISKTMIWSNPHEKGGKFDNKYNELSHDGNNQWLGMIDNLSQSCRDANYTIVRGFQAYPAHNSPGSARATVRVGGLYYRPVLELVR